MKKWILALLLVPSLVFASGDEGHIDTAPDRSNDMASLQNGAKLFVNYCVSCHAASMMRYTALKKIGFTEDVIKRDLLLATDNMGDTMNVAMRMKDAAEWFGKAPPDLTVIARAKATHSASGRDWLYTYLRTFYRDAARPTGWNNLTLSNVAMPHILWERQGPVEVTIKNAESKKDEKTGEAFVQLTEKKYDAQGLETILKDEKVKSFDGHLGQTYSIKPLDEVKAKQFESDMADLANFLDYMAEPNRASRQWIGAWFMAALVLLAFVTWRLNKAFWKDVK